MKRHLLLLLFVMLAAVSAARQRTRTERLMDEMRDPKSKYVFVAAHRGDWRNWPENSVAANFLGSWGHLRSPISLWGHPRLAYNNAESGIGQTAYLKRKSKQNEWTCGLHNTTFGAE